MGNDSCTKLMCADYTCVSRHSLPAIGGPAQRNLSDLHRRSTTLFRQFLPSSNRLCVLIARVLATQVQLTGREQRKCIVSKRITGKGVAPISDLAAGVLFAPHPKSCRMKQM